LKCISYYFLPSLRPPLFVRPCHAFEIALGHNASVQCDYSTLNLACGIAPAGRAKSNTTPCSNYYSIRTSLPSKSPLVTMPCHGLCPMRLCYLLRLFKSCLWDFTRPAGEIKCYYPTLHHQPSP
jgi:hypothetical protein